jgi:hypothetical protein
VKFVCGIRVVLDHSCQVQRHPLAERGNDLYETPPTAVEALLRIEKIPHRVWEPACGHGNIVKVLRAAGHDVLATVLVDYGDSTASYRRDFLMESMPPGREAIVTNPPFKLVEEFVAHAIEICPLVIMLLRWAFYESDRRTDILEGCGLARIHCFRKRLPMMHRAGWKGRKANSRESAMTASIIRFPLRRVCWVLIVRERDGAGWLALCGSCGWLFGSLVEARHEAGWLARNSGLPVREIVP